MLFNSSAFIVLVVMTFVIYYIPYLRKHQVSILLLSSFIFYAYGQPLLLVLLISSASITTLSSYKTARSSHRKSRLVWSVGGVVVNLLVLAFFKYNALLANLIMSDIHNLDGIGQIIVTLPLPIGISFYTFQGISLLLDTLRSEKLNLYVESDKALGIGRYWKNTLFYIAFFPQLVAGPIVKAHQFFPQINPKSIKTIEWETVIKCLVMGYFLKMVIADNLKDQTFWIDYPYFMTRSSANLVVLLYGYSMQIFSDFAGYSLIAIGVAALFGYKLPKNFNFPYISQSFSEFWTRWHISLSTWLRDYLYFPLGGSRKGSMRTYINLMIVMFLGGLWHGAAWSYAVWGLWHGLALTIERPLLNTWFYTTQTLAVKTFRIVLVFTLVTFAWLLFKLPEFGHVLAYLNAIATNITVHSGVTVIFLIILFSIPPVLYHLFYLLRRKFQSSMEMFSPVVYSFLLLGIIFNSGTPNAFIYFQF